MKLILLGTGGYHPSDSRHTACLMLPTAGIVLDAGTAMFRVRDWLETDHLDILLTHAHLDHVVGLTFIFDVLYKKHVSRVTAHLAAEKIAAVREHLFAEPIFPVEPPFDFSPVESLEQLGDCRVTWFPLEHPGGSIGYRLDWNDRSMAYVTDTVADENAAYVRLIEDVDLLVHECYFADEANGYARRTGHSWARAVASVAQKARVGRLALVHVNPVLNEYDPIGMHVVKDIFPDAVLGTDRMELEF